MIHLHVYSSNWSKKLDPEDFLQTKFDANYSSISNNMNLVIVWNGGN